MVSLLAPGGATAGLAEAAAAHLPAGALPLAHDVLPREVIQFCAPEAAGQAAEQASQEVGFFCRWVFTLTGGDAGWSRFILDYIIQAPVRIVVILALAWLANRLVRRGIRKLVEQLKDTETPGRFDRLRQRTGLSALDSGRIPSARRAQRADALGGVLRSIARVLIWTIALVMVLGELGVPIGPVLASAGIVGIAVGFGAQNLVRDFISGLFMLAEDQYGIGDIVDLGDAIGIVEGVSLRTTRLRDIGGTLWHIPNGEIRRVGNMSQEWARVVIDVPVAYGTDLEHAKAVIKEVADATAQDATWGPDYMEEAEIWGIERLADSGIDIRLAIKVQPGTQWMLQRELRGRIKDAFDEAGIEIPFPQRTLWLRTDLTGATRPPVIETAPVGGEGLPPPDGEGDAESGDGAGQPRGGGPAGEQPGGPKAPGTTGGRKDLSGDEAGESPQRTPRRRAVRTRRRRREATPEATPEDDNGGGPS